MKSYVERMGKLRGVAMVKAPKKRRVKTATEKKTKGRLTTKPRPGRVTASTRRLGRGVGTKSGTKLGAKKKARTSLSGFRFHHEACQDHEAFQEKPCGEEPEA